MKTVVCVAVALIIDIPDDDAAMCAPLLNNPLDELAERLRREVCHGRDGGRPNWVRPHASPATAGQECNR